MFRVSQPKSFVTCDLRVVCVHLDNQHNRSYLDNFEHQVEIRFSAFENSKLWGGYNFCQQFQMMNF